MRQPRRRFYTGIITFVATYIRVCTMVVKQVMFLFIPLLFVLFFVAILIYFFNFTSYLAPFVYSLF